MISISGASGSGIFEIFKNGVVVGTEFFWDEIVEKIRQ
jgi:hypothetical protein